jgi:integrase/recombinase XerD
MSFSPCLVRSSTAAGDARFALGDPLVDRYLEFVAGRSRPNTLRAVAFDLKAFFSVVAKDPIEVVASDVFEFLAHQRGDRTVIRMSDGEFGIVGADDRAAVVVGVGVLRVCGRPW